MKNAVLFTAFLCFRLKNYADIARNKAKILKNPGFMKQCIYQLMLILFIMACPGFLFNESAYAQAQTIDSKEKANKLLEEVLAEKAPKRKKETPDAGNNYSNNKKPDSRKNFDPAWEAIRRQKLDTQFPFTLTELIDIALRNNPLTRQAWENTMAARFIERQAESRLYPQLSISGQATREKTEASNPVHNTNDLHFGPAAKLTYLLLDFGGRKAGIEGAFQGILSADAQYSQAIQDLLLDVEKAYYGLYSAQSILDAAQLDVENANADFEAAQQKFEAGLVAKLEVLQAKSNYEDSLYNLEEAKGQVKRSKAYLAQTIGFSADTDFEIVSPDKPLPTDVDEEDVSQLIEEAMNRRPDVLAARAQLKAAQEAVKEAASSMLPSLNLGGAGAKNEYKYYNSAARREHEYEYSGYVSLDWNIFDGFYNLNKKRQANSQAKIAFDELIQAEINLSAEVWVKYYDFKTAVSKLKYSQSFFDTANTSYELALESYKAGLKSILDLLQAQSQLSEARSRLIQSKEDLFIALADLAHATGSLNASGKEEKQTSLIVPRGQK